MMELKVQVLDTKLNWLKEMLNVICVMPDYCILLFCEHLTSIHTLFEDFTTNPS